MIRFTHCYLAVTDFDEAVKFYGQLFGGNPTYLEPNSWASWFEGQFCINRDGQAVCGDNAIPGFEVTTESEFDDLYQSLRCKGVKVSIPTIVPNTPGYYYKYIWVTDDWGNNIEIAYSTHKMANNGLQPTSKGAEQKSC